MKLEENNELKSFNWYFLRILPFYFIHNTNNIS